MQYLHELVGYHKQLPANIVIHGQDNYYEMEEHWHRSLEITYMMSPAIATVQGICQQLNEGDILLVNSGEIHRVVAVDPSDVKAVTVIISYELLEKLVPDYDSYRFAVRKNERKYKDFVDVFQAIYCVYTKEQDVYGYLKVNELLYRLMYLMFAYFQEKKTIAGQIKSEKYFTNLKQIMCYMEENHKMPLKQEAIAKRFGLSKEYLSRFFKKYTGCTCMEYLEHVRLKYAYLQLMEEDCSMLDIALDNGFADARSFTNVFKRTYGVTPFQYKKNKMNSKD